MSGRQSISGQQKTAIVLVSIVAVMVSLSFAAVPLYNMFCRVTGFAGTTSVAEKPSSVISDKTIIVRFDASKDRGMPWDFKPVQREMTIRLGETGLAFFEAYNPTDRVIGGTASYNVTPDTAGGYFTKIECFCFTEQVLQPHERAEMPVTFYVDPEILKDQQARHIEVITLSYTFHETPLPEDAAALPSESRTGSADAIVRGRTILQEAAAKAAVFQADATDTLAPDAPAAVN